MPPISINNKYLITSLNNNYKFIFFGLILITYFAWMDIALFYHIQKWSPAPIPNKNETNVDILNQRNEQITVFKPLSVKLIMVDHVSHYIHDVFTRFLEDTLHFTKIFPWVTPNFISFSGLAIAIVGARLIISDNLFYCRIGVILSEIRNMGDSLDGVVFRSKQRQSELVKQKLIVYESNYGSKGYNIDALCDGLGGLLFIIAILIKFLRKLPMKCKKFYLLIYQYNN